MNPDPLPRDWFEQWHPLEDVERAVKAFRPMHSDRRFQWWSEAWVGTRFLKARGQQSSRLRLTPENSPLGDCQLEGRGVQSTYEITQVLNERTEGPWNRLRACGKLIFEDSAAAISGDLARRTIAERIKKKARKKGYAAGAGLIIYLQLWNDFERRGFKGLLPDTPHPFSSIWLLLGSGAVRQIFPK